MKFRDKFYPKTLQFSLQDFHINGFFCDVTLTVDGHEIQAHKLILSAASPYFRAMFNSESSFIESNKKKINLYGIDKDALFNIIEFIYSSDIEINEKNVFLLMEAANLLQIHSLRTHINFYLQSLLTIENCIQMYVMANLHQYHDLATSAFKYILINFSKIVNKDEFLELPFEILLEIVSSKLLDVTDEETLCKIIIRWLEADIENRNKYSKALISKIYLHHLSSKFLTRLTFDPLLSDDLKEKIQEFTDYASTINIGNVIVKDKKFGYQKSRHKAEKAVIFAIGGESCGMASHSVECFTLGYDKWRYIVPECIIQKHETRFTNVLPPLRCSRYYAASANDAYNVYVIGGRNSTSLLDECEIFNVKINQWNYFPKLPNKLFASGAAFLERELVVAGGCTDEGVVDTVWKLDETHKSWIAMPPLTSPRYFHGVVSLGGFIFVLGGYDQKSALRTCEKFDPGCNKWFEISSMHHARAKFGCAAVDDCIYVFGGTCDENDNLKTVERYNIFTNEWSYETSMTIPRHSFSVAVSDHEIYCLGGSDGTHFLDTVEKFSLRTKRWHCVHSMQIARFAPSAAALLVPFATSE